MNNNQMSQSPQSPQSPESPKMPPTQPPYGWQVPPPGPKPEQSLVTKAINLGLQCVILMVGALIIWGLIESRDQRSNEVAD